MKAILKTITIGLVCSTLVSNSQTFTNYTTIDGLSHDNVTCLAADASDNIWFGTQEGVSFFDGSNWTVHTESTDAGLVHNTISAICVVANGDVWVGSDYGAAKYDGSSWTTYTTAEGLGDDRVNHIAQDASGTIWFGNYDGVTKFDGTTWTSYTTSDGLPFGGVVHTNFDSNGDKWFSTDLGGIVHYDGTTFTDYTTSDGLLANRVRSVFVDDQDNKWAGTSKGVTVLDNTNQWAANHTMMYIMPAPDTLNPVEDIAMDSQGHIWTGVYVDYLVTVGGIAMYNGTYWIDYDMSDGLVGAVIRKLIVDGQDNVWIATSTGVSRLSGATSIEEGKADLVKVYIYPNPANNSVNIETSSKSPLKVFNLLGKVIYADNLNNEITSIDVRDWDKGIYLVQVGATTKKLIID